MNSCRWINGNWRQLGQDIVGLLKHEEGQNISLDKTGYVLTTGTEKGGEYPRDWGTLKTFQWDGQAWLQRGHTIQAERIGRMSFGGSPAISGDGSTIIVGSPELHSFDQNVPSEYDDPDKKVFIGKVEVFTIRNLLE